MRYTLEAPLLVVVTLVVGGTVSFSAWIYTYAIERVGMKPLDAAYLNSLFWTTCTVGRLCMSPLAACFSAGALLVPTLAIELLAVAVLLLYPDSQQVLWVGTTLAGVGVCGTYSNVLSLLMAYDLLTPRVMSAIAMSSAIGHMTVPNFVGLVTHYSSWRHAALPYVLMACYSLGFVLVAAVVVHLRRNFIPVHGVGAPQRARGRLKVLEADDLKLQTI